MKHSASRSVRYAKISFSPLSGSAPYSGNGGRKDTTKRGIGDFYTEIIITFKKKKDVRRSLNSCQNEHGQLLCAFDSRRQPASALAYRSNHLSGTKLENFDDLEKKIEEKISKWKKSKNLDVKDFMLFVALELQLRASTRNDKHFSFYLDLYETNDTITLRISDHHFDAATTIQHPAKYTTSLTFSNEHPEDWDYFKPDPHTHAIEYVYYEDKVTKDDLISIANDIIGFVETGKFKPSVQPNETNKSPKNMTGNYNTTLQFGEISASPLLSSLKTAAPKPIKAEDFATKDDYLRPVLCTVFCDNGYKIATDTYILVKIKADYPKQLEGRLYVANEKKFLKHQYGTKVESIDGKTVLAKDEYFYPNYAAIIPDPKKQHSIAVNLSDLYSYAQELADFAKQNKKKDAYLVPFYAPDGQFLFAISSKYLVQFISAGIHIKADTLYFSDDIRAISFQKDGNVILQMPMRWVNDDVPEYSDKFPVDLDFGLFFRSYKFQNKPKFNAELAKNQAIYRLGQNAQTLKFLNHQEISYTYDFDTETRTQILNNPPTMITAKNFKTAFADAKRKQILDQEALDMEADINALLPYYDTDKEAKEAIDNAIKEIDRNAAINAKGKGIDTGTASAPSSNAAAIARAKLALVKVKLKLQLQLKTNNKD